MYFGNEEEYTTFPITIVKNEIHSSLLNQLHVLMRIIALEKKNQQL